MCLGNTYTCRRCGREQIEYTGAGKCDLEEPFPAMHRVHGWRSTTETCTRCEEGEAAQARSTARGRATLNRIAKGVLEWRDGIRAQPRIRDQADWFVPRNDMPAIEASISQLRVNEGPLTQHPVAGSVGVESGPVPVAVRRPMYFLEHVRVTHGGVVLGMFPGLEEETLFRDAYRYLAYLTGIEASALSAQCQRDLKLMYNRLRALERANFDFKPGVTGIESLRTYASEYWIPPQGGEDYLSTESAWHVLLIDYKSYMTASGASEELFADWRASRDALAINDRRTLYGFPRQDHQVVGNRWLIYSEPPFRIITFRVWVQRHVKLRTLENCDLALPYVNPGVVMCRQMTYYTDTHLYRLGTTEQVREWHGRCERSCIRPFNWSPGPDFPDFPSFANFEITETGELRHPHLSSLEVVDRYREAIYARGSWIMIASFNSAWRAYIDSARDLLNGVEELGLPDFVPAVRNALRLLLDIIQEARKLALPGWRSAAYENPVYTLLQPVVLVLEQRSAHWVPLTTAEEAVVQARLRACSELCENAPLIWEVQNVDDDDEDSPPSIVDEEEASDTEEDDESELNMTTVPARMVRLQHLLHATRAHGLHGDIDTTAFLNWRGGSGEELAYDEPLQEGVLAYFLDAYDRVMDEAPQAPGWMDWEVPDVWFEAGGPLADVEGTDGDDDGDSLFNWVEGQEWSLGRGYRIE